VFKEDPKYYSKLVEMGVKKIITDLPEKALDF